MSQEKLEKIRQSIVSISNVANIVELEELENKYLSRKSGELTLILKGLSALAVEEKKKIGALANQVKSELVAKITEQRKKLSSSHTKVEMDVTLPVKKDKLGHLHIISKTQYELEDIFSSMGFMVLDGPELESEHYSFNALNIPATHPARDMQDTFFVEGGDPDNQYVLRPHTSPVEIRAMHKYGAPLRCIVPGQCYRNEALDARHEFSFCQIEGLMIGEGISIANLIAVAKTFLSAIFKKEVEVRLRPGHFPFVEPGVELDFSCLLCGGKGCKVCKGLGWVEFMGAGMTHPNVLKAGGIDASKYSGFAFGMGLERLIMMKYGIDDIRYFRSGDLRFLRQF